jgi:hypothetical protein
LGFVEVEPGLGTGDVHVLDISVKSSRVPLRVVLVYSDYPGPTLVNNLNLIATSPTGRHYVGNHAASGVLQMDAKNNVEVLQVKKPHAGDWKLQVIGSNVPHGPQPFAIVFIADADV